MIEKQSPGWAAPAPTRLTPVKTLRRAAGADRDDLRRGRKPRCCHCRGRSPPRTLMYRERLVVDTERARIQRNMERHKVEMFSGTATFVDAHTVKAGDATLSADVFLIATGSRPHRPS